jgi:hypothetical protein
MAISVYTSLLTLDEAPSGTVTVQDAGTTTPRAIFTDTGLSVAATNPIPLDSSGRATQGIIYTAAGAYKVIVKSSAGTTLYTRDNIDPGVPIGSGALAIANGGTSATTAEAALAALGGATAAELAEVAADVASVVGTLASTEGTHIATGTTAQRASAPSVGDIRRNTTTNKWEGYDGTWDDFLNDDDIATQANQETGTSTTTLVTPGRQHFHQSACKAWARIDVSGGTPSLAAGYNVSGTITDNGVGDYTFTFTTALSSANYACVASARQTDNSVPSAIVHTQATTTVRIKVWGPLGAEVDPLGISFVVYGDI